MNTLSKASMLQVIEASVHRSSNIPILLDQFGGLVIMILINIMMYHAGVKVSGRSFL